MLILSVCRKTHWKNSEWTEDNTDLDLFKYPFENNPIFPANIYLFIWQVISLDNWFWQMMSVNHWKLGFDLCTSHTTRTVMPSIVNFYLNLKLSSKLKLKISSSDHLWSLRRILLTLLLTFSLTKGVLVNALSLQNNLSEELLVKI